MALAFVAIKALRQCEVIFSKQVKLTIIKL